MVEGHCLRKKEFPFEKRVPFVAIVPQGHHFGTLFSLSVRMWASLVVGKDHGQFLIECALHSLAISIASSLSCVMGHLFGNFEKIKKGLFMPCSGPVSRYQTFRL